MVPEKSASDRLSMSSNVSNASSVGTEPDKPDGHNSRWRKLVSKPISVGSVEVS